MGPSGSGPGPGPPLGADPDPTPVLGAWWARARAVAGPGFDAMAVATVDDTGAATVRTVICRGLRGPDPWFVTDARSPKARHLAVRPRAEGLLVWPALGRQVRIAGTVGPAPDHLVARWWASRDPHRRRLAWAWPQSSPVSGPDELRSLLAGVVRRWGDDPPPPPHWIGLTIRATRVELWEQDPEGLHRRVEHRRVDGTWRMRWLAP